MHSTSLRKVGGSIMMTIPPALLDQLDLKAGTVVDLRVEGRQLIVQPQTKPRYTLDELLAQCSPEDWITEEDRLWLDVNPVGRELL